MINKIAKRIVAGFLMPALGTLVVSRLLASPSPTSGSGWEFASPPQISPPLTAKAQLTNARNLAKKWQADASLVNIIGPSLDTNGVSLPSSAYSWSYTFVSKKTDNILMISVGNAADVAAMSKIMTDNSYFFFIGAGAGLTGTVQERGALATGCQALPDEFLDSDKATAAAKSAGYKPGSQIEMHLSRCEGGPAAWELSAFKVDAVTGKPVK